MGGWRTLEAEGFSLERTLASGQFFMYSREEMGGEGAHYVLLTHGRAVRIAQEGNALRYRGADAAFVRRLFSLHSSHRERIARLSRDPVIGSLAREYAGLRIMRQELHATALSFICSSNASIPKIRMSLHLLARGCGPVVDGHHHLPLPGTAIAEEDARAAKTGYRARFLVASHNLLTPVLLSRIARSPYPRSHALLMGLPGVGPKVADCVCLFALGQGRAFPVDVHVLRAMRELFPEEKFPAERAAKEFAQRRWGEDAGFAQQLIFEKAREQARGQARGLPARGARVPA